MSRQLVLALLVVSLPLLAPATVPPRAVMQLAAADVAAPCHDKCVADERECLASAPCTAGTAAEQTECKRQCEQTYSFCLAAC